MAFGSGVRRSALSFERMDEAYETGRVAATAIGFLPGATVFTGANQAPRSQAPHGRRYASDRQALCMNALSIPRDSALFLRTRPVQGAGGRRRISPVILSRRRQCVQPCADGT